MNYQRFIEENFLIDEPKAGQLVPFVFNKVQKLYYEELKRDYDIEKCGLATPVREIILKARREGFSSLILALFAADDITQENPTETLVISYRDDATETFRKRYRLYLTSAFAFEAGYDLDFIRANPYILDEMAKQYFSVDAGDIEIKHNKAHFYCGTASARTGGRGGVLQKLLFSEEAHYPDTEKMAAKEIVDGTLRQVDIAAGWVFRESTANGYGNYYEQTWAAAVAGSSRFKNRFYGWQLFYSQAEFDIIASETTDKAILKQEYPMNPEEAFISSGSAYFDNEKIFEYVKIAVPPVWRGNIYLECQHPNTCPAITVCDFKLPRFEEDANGKVQLWEKPIDYHAYILGGDVAEGIGKDASVARIIDAASLKTVGKFKDTLCPPDEFAVAVFALATWYNTAYVAVEANKDGLWVNKEIFKMGYSNLYWREAFDDVSMTVGRKMGFLTDPKTRPFILSELRKMLAVKELAHVWNDREFLDECLVFVRGKTGKPEAMVGKHDDEVLSHAIALEVRRNSPQAFTPPTKVAQNSESYVMQRLERLKKSRNGMGSMPRQEDYL